MEYINELLARVHYLNHPYISITGAIGMLFMGAYVLSRDTKSELYRVYFTWNFILSLWFIGNGVSMFYYKNLEVAVIGFRIAYLGIPFIAPLSYHFYVTYFRKLKTPLFYTFYILALLESIYLIFTSDIRQGATTLFNVGLFWRGMPRFSYFLILGVTTFITGALISAFSFLRESRNEVNLFKKNQFRSLAIFFFAYSLGSIEWFVAFGIPMHAGWMAIPGFMGTMAYSIIHYRAMEVETVVHRTILWISTILLLVLPAGVVGLVLLNIISPSYIPLRIATLSVYLILFVVYYTRLRPRIDMMFRRRKYDYQTILGKVAEKIATTINIEDLTKQLLNEICETMYLRNSMLYVLSKDGKSYSLVGRRGYREVDGIRQRESLEVYTKEDKVKPGTSPADIKCENNTFCKWAVEHRDVIEKEQVEINPLYEGIRKEASGWFKEYDLELMVPLVLEDKVDAILGLGRKENLQSYTIKDLELLKKLGQEVGVTVFNALHYEDLAEKERLDEEMRMGRQIQVNLLPQKTPQIAGLIVQGLMNPAKEIGGDYYDFIIVSGRDELGIVIGDVSGKGVAAGLLMTMAKMAIHALSQHESSPRQILLKANTLLYDQIGGQKFMTLLYLLWQAKTKTLLYSSAGHEHILICRSGAGVVEAIVSGGFMLGMIPEISTFLEETRIPFEVNDKILLYTDGVTEAQNANGERFGLPKLKEVFLKHSLKPAAELMKSVKDEVYGFIGDHPQYDDITLVVLEAR